MEQVKAAIYARFSSDLQRATSIEDQVRQCRKLINTHNWTVSDQHIYEDFAISGTDNTRQAYMCLKADAAAGKFQVVVVDDLSRLCRNTAESIGVYQELQFVGVRIVSVTDGIDTGNTTAKLPYYLKSIMNEVYLDDLKEKVLRGMKGQVERGYSVGGRVYGYRSKEVLDPSGTRDKSGRPRRLGVKIEIDQEQAEVVKYIFELKLIGMGVKSITKVLNEKSIEPPQNPRSNHKKSWATSTVWAILNSEKYIGDWSWNKYRYPKIPGSSKRKRVELPKTEWVINNREDLRIIDSKTWDTVQAMRQQYQPVNKLNNGKLTGYHGTNHRAKYLLSGLLQCGQCGGSLIVISSGKRSVFVCNNHWSRGDTVCTNKVRLKRDEIEDAVVETLKTKLSNHEFITEIRNRVQKFVDSALTKTTNDAKANKQRLEQVQKELENLVAFVAEGDTSDTIRQAIYEKEQLIKSFKTQLGGLLSSPVPKNYSISNKQITARLESLKALFTKSQESLKLIQAELRNFFEGKIIILPEDMGDHFKLTGKIRSKLSALLDPSLSVIVYGGGGNRTPVRI